MLDDAIDDNEVLYRAVIVHPHMWKESENRPSSAAFKDSKGVSVDQKKNRDEGEALEFLKDHINRDLKAVVSLQVNDCIEINTQVKAQPLEDNPYHAVIFRNSEKAQLTSGQAKKLVKKSQIVQILTED